MKKLIIHGHFYQPPRENPWTGRIPVQGSALPFANWNARIQSECYTANSVSRYINGFGKIEKIINNYEYLSFNFGPTLLSWMEEFAPETYERILEADKISADRLNGHGNAVAQGYNHTILPLSPTKNDIRTQVKWGVEDFRCRFQRDAEGIWLPETAINKETIDVLVEEGIKFVILSPWQGEKIRNPKEKWKELKDQPTPFDRPFSLAESDGKLAAFFYNPELASGISFEHYLRDADTLYQRLNDLFNHKGGHNLLSVATDGEIYGHHEAYGDMCLSALVQKFAQGKVIEFTNYAAYLADNPPVEEVMLRRGEEGKGTSWSCFHGVSRWYKDCGCSTGGGEHWNQAWRTPLRKAFDKLYFAMREIYLQEILHFSETDPDHLIFDYIHYMINPAERENWLKKHLKQDADDEAVNHFLTLMEGQRFAQFIYTSCGWFFSDISGIEPMQNLKYAARGIELYQYFTEDDFADDFFELLEEAQSNIPEKGNGKELYLTEVARERFSTDYSPAVFAFGALYALPGTGHRWGDFELQEMKTDKAFPTLPADDTISGTMRIKRLSLNSSRDYEFTLSVNSYISQGIKVKGRMGSYRIALNSLPEEVQQSIVWKISALMEKVMVSHIPQNFPHLKDFLKLTSELPLGKENYSNHNALLFLNYQLNHYFDQVVLCSGDKDLEARETLSYLLKWIKEHSFLFKKKEFEHKLKKQISRYVEQLIKKENPETLKKIRYLMFTGWENGLDPINPVIQNRLYRILRNDKERAYLKELGLLFNIEPF